MRHPQKLIAAAGIALLLAVGVGCEGGWQAYQQIEIGEPLPKGHLLLREGMAAKRGRGWGRYSACPLLASYSAEVVSILVDGSGTVKAKLYHASALGHWGVLMAAETHTIVEISVPEAVYRDPPADWEGPDCLFRSPELVAMGLTFPSDGSASESPEATTDRPPSVAAASTQAATRETPAGTVRISEKRLTERARERLQRAAGEVPVTLGTDVDLSGVPGAGEIPGARGTVFRTKDGATYLKITSTGLEEPTPNVLEFIHALDFPAPPVKPERAFRFPGCPLLLYPIYALYMYHYGGVFELMDVARFPAAFAGIMRDGFDWTYTDWQGGTIRFQNLGGRRIRVELTRVTRSDAFACALMRKFRSHDENHLYKTVAARCTQRIEDRPRDPQGYVCRGATYARKYYWDEALADYAKATALTPGDATTRKAYEDLQARMDRYDRGLPTIYRRTKWIDLGGRSIAAMDGFDYGWDDDGHRGIADFTRAIRNDPRSAPAYSNRGVSYYDLGRHKEALGDFTKAVELDPNYAYAWGNRAHTHTKLKQYAEAWADVDACKAAGGYFYDDFMDHLRKVAPRPK